MFLYVAMSEVCTVCRWLPIACLLLALSAPPARAADYPAWWLWRGVVNTNAAVTNDYAAANAGQLKWFGLKAYDELAANLSGGAGTEAAAVVQAFSLSNNYVFVNVGQAKAVAAPFYTRLIEESQTNDYPWTSGTTTDDVDYAACNIGQLKYAFSFDLDRDEDNLPDWWEIQETGGTTNLTSGTDDEDEDGLDNRGEYEYSSDPYVWDSDDDSFSDGDEVDNRTDPTNDDITKPTIWIVFPENNFRTVWMP